MSEHIELVVEKQKENVLPIVINEARLILDVEQCCACGIVFAFPTSFKNSRKRDRRNFYCPNGHAQWYPE